MLPGRQRKTEKPNDEGVCREYIDGQADITMSSVLVVIFFEVHCIRLFHVSASQRIYIHIHGLLMMIFIVVAYMRRYLSEFRYTGAPQPIVQSTELKNITAYLLYTVDDTSPPRPVQLVCTNLPGASSRSYVCAPK